MTLPEYLLTYYRVLGILGRGAQGVVYLVLDERTGQRQAAKVVPRSTLAQQRLRRESDALSLVHSPHVAQHVGLGFDPMQGWVMLTQVIPGAPLSTFATGLPLWTPKRVCELVSQVADALTCVQQAGLLLRDLSPAQVLVHQHRGHLSACLVDLGLARRAEVPSDLTEPGVAPGTPGFTAPEWVADGQGSMASDTYSLAALVWWLLSGHPPYHTHNAELTFALQLTESPAPLDIQRLGYRLGQHEALSQWLCAALSPVPKERPQTPLAFVEGLRPLLLS